MCSSTGTPFARAEFIQLHESPRQGILERGFRPLRRPRAFSGREHTGNAQRRVEIRLRFEIVRRRLAQKRAQVAGFRYFNVYGPHEAHKGRMASVMWHFFHQFRAEGHVKLFEGTGGIANGEQRRDFVSVDDVVRVNLDFLEHPERSGIFNVGSGRAETYNAVATSVVNAVRAADGKPGAPLDALVREGAIRYIPFPPALVGKYQTFTQADLTKLRASGYQAPTIPLDEGVRRYVEWLMARERA